MKVCVYLSYIGLGANLLHLSYVHQISEKFGPVTVITLCKNLSDALEDDPKIREFIVIDKKYNKLKNIFSFSLELKKYNFDAAAVKKQFIENIFFNKFIIKSVMICTPWGVLKGGGVP